MPLASVPWHRLLGYLSPYKLRLVIALLCLGLSSALGLVLPLGVGRLLDSALNQSNLTQLNLLALALLGLFFFQAIFLFGQSYNLTYIGERIVLDLRAQLYRKLQYQSLDFYANRRVGELVSRLTSDVTQVRAVLTNNMTQFLSQIITLVGSIVLVFAINPALMVFTLVLAPLLILVAMSFGRRVETRSVLVQDELASATVTVEESLQGIRVVKSFTREEYEIDRYDGTMQRMFAAALKLSVFRSMFTATISFVSFAGLVAFLWFSGREVIEGRLTIGGLTSILIYGFSIAASLGGMAGMYSQFREALGATRRVFELLDLKPDILDRPDAVELPRVDGRITLDHVSFSYDRIAPVLDDVTLDIAPGEIVALVGPSGAGKTTLFNLIPRFYDPTAGAVTMDGVDIRDVTQHSLREQIGLVPQDTLLFGGTVRENIAYGRLDATDEEVVAAAQAANAHDFIMALPDQYAAIVGERGAKLSGGQRQRIAIARAILKDPRILLLDEATSALDSESEQLVAEALDRLMRGRTTLMIAHRLSTIKAAHRIAVLDHGRIVELGTHEELMTLNGLYARLYLMQFRETPPEASPLPAPDEEPTETLAAPSAGLLGGLASFLSNPTG